MLIILVLMVSAIQCSSGSNANSSAKACSSTELHEAVKKCNVELTEKILKNGSDVYAKDCYGRTPLHYALIQTGYCSSQISFIEAFINKGFDLNKRFANGNTILFDAIAERWNTAIETLLRYGSIVNIENHEGHTPLLEALRSERDGPARTLLMYRADARTIKKRMEDSMRVSISRGKVDQVRLLLRLGFNMSEAAEQISYMKHAVLVDNPATVNVLAPLVDWSKCMDHRDKWVDILASAKFAKRLSGLEAIAQHLYWNGCYFPPEQFPYDLIEDR